MVGLLVKHLERTEFPKLMRLSLTLEHPSLQFLFVGTIHETKVSRRETGVFLKGQVKGQVRVILTDEVTTPGRKILRPTLN